MSRYVILMALLGAAFPIFATRTTTVTKNGDGTRTIVSENHVDGSSPSALLVSGEDQDLSVLAHAKVLASYGHSVLVTAVLPAESLIRSAKFILIPLEALTLRDFASLRAERDRVVLILCQAKTLALKKAVLAQINREPRADIILVTDKHFDDLQKQTLWRFEGIKQLQFQGDVIGNPETDAVMFRALLDKTIGEKSPRPIHKGLNLPGLMIGLGISAALLSTWRTDYLVSVLMFFGFVVIWTSTSVALRSNAPPSSNVQERKIAGIYQKRGGVWGGEHPRFSPAIPPDLETGCVVGGPNSPGLNSFETKALRSFRTISYQILARNDDLFQSAIRIQRLLREDVKVLDGTGPASSPIEAYFTGEVSPSDFRLICVAVLRDVGIPARANGRLVEVWTEAGWRLTPNLAVPQMVSKIGPVSQ